jgi:ketosteroid isomerase-like protein
MPTSSKTLIELEKRFWQAIVDEDADAAIEMLSEPSMMVNAHGAMQFDHQSYRRMAEKGPMVLESFELSDMKVVFPNESTAVLTYHVKQKTAQRGDGKAELHEMNDTSTWIRTGDRWQCVLHTETPANAKTAH